MNNTLYYVAAFIFENLCLTCKQFVKTNAHKLEIFQTSIDEKAVLSWPTSIDFDDRVMETRESRLCHLNAGR